MFGQKINDKGLVDKGMEITMLPSYSCVPNSCVQYLSGERLVPGRWRFFPESIRLGVGGSRPGSACLTTDCTD